MKYLYFCFKTHMKYLYFCFSLNLCILYYFWSYLSSQYNYLKLKNNNNHIYIFAYLRKSIFYIIREYQINFDLKNKF